MSKSYQCCEQKQKIIFVAIIKYKLVENAYIEQKLTKSFVDGRSIFWSPFPYEQCNREKSNTCITNSNMNMREMATSRLFCSLTIIKSRTNHTKRFSNDAPNTFLSVHQMLETNRRRKRSAYSDLDCVWQKKAHIWDYFQILLIFRRVKASLPISLCAKPTIQHATDTTFQNCCVQLKTNIYLTIDSHMGNE
jgi:hypothetical protein